MINQLPSSGTPPEPTEYGCDTSGMLVVHRMFRYLFTDAPRLVREVGAGDTRRASVVCDHIAEIADGLHNHHVTEDETLWDDLESRARSCRMHVEQMKAQHARVAELLDKLRPALGAWRHTAGSADAETTARILDEIRSALFRHLGDEETLILPTAATVMTQREWDAFGERGLASVPKSRLMIQLGFLLQPFSPSERDTWMKANLPAFARVLYRLFGRRQFEAHYERVYGIPPATWPGSAGAHGGPPSRETS